MTTESQWQGLESAMERALDDLGFAWALNLNLRPYVERVLEAAEALELAR